MTSKKLSILGILVALHLVLSFFSVNVSIFTFSFSILTTILIAQIAGPLWAAGIFGLSDILMDIFHGWPINPVFTLGAMLSGLLFGAVMWRRKVGKRSVKRLLLILTLDVVLVQMLIFSLALSIQTGSNFWGTFLLSFSNLVDIPLDMLLIFLVLPAIQRLPQMRENFGKIES